MQTDLYAKINLYMISVIMINIIKSLMYALLHSCILWLSDRHNWSRQAFTKLFFPKLQSQLKNGKELSLPSAISSV